MIIYAYTTQSDSKKGWIKIGEVSENRKGFEKLTVQEKAIRRIKEQDSTSNSEPLIFLYAEQVNNLGDRDIHAWLQKRRVYRTRSSKEDGRR